MANRARTARLIGFPPSVDTETARWILGHHEERFREVRQSPVGAALRTLWHRATIPILLGDDGKLSPSRPIADFLDGLHPERRLVPSEPEQAAKVDQMWAEFNGEMGVWIAQWIYHDVLSKPALARRLTTEGVPGWQRVLQRLLNPLTVFVMKRGLKLHQPETADRALALCRRTFVRVEERLSDGRPFLAGEQLTLADLAFSVCAAPLMLDQCYGGTLPAEADASPRLREVAREFRATLAGRYALRMYAEHYRPLRSG